MAYRTTMGLTAMCCLLGGTLGVCAAQVKYTPPPPPLTTLPPCPVPKDAKDAKKIARRTDCDPTNRPLPPASPAPAAASAPITAAQKFPYPGENTAENPGEATGANPGNHTSEEAANPDTSAAKAFPFPGDAAPATPQAAPAESAAKRFPYPGDSTPTPAPVPAPVPAAAPAPAPPAAESSSSSTSSDDAPAPAGSASATPSRLPVSDDDDDGQPKLADMGSEGKRNRKTVKPQTDDDRVDEDLSVAKFYGQSGNAMGAYLRAKDAVKTEPDLPEARFVMGEAAQRLHKKDEAKAEFSEYLRLAPDGVHAKAAEKALSELR